MSGQPDSLWKNGTLLLFCLVLFLFLLFQGPLLGALAIGFVLFAAYGLRTGHSAGAVLRMAWHGCSLSGPSSWSSCSSAC